MDIGKKIYKALMLDVDGTLVINKQDALPTERVREAIAKAKKKMHVGLATGRPLHMVAYLIDALDLSGPCIINGGIQLVEAKSKKIIKQIHINLTDIHEIITITKKLDIDLWIAEENKDIVYHDGYIFKNPLGLFTHAIDEELADAFIKEASHISTISAHKTSSWEKNKVHVGINHVGATKEHAIFDVAKILGIETHEIIGVGD